MIILYYTIGNSDIVLDEHQRFYSFNETLDSLHQHIKEENAIIKDGIEIKKNSTLEYKIKFNKNDEYKTSFLNKIEFPLIRALMDELCLKNIKPEKIILFVTQQESFHPQDTFFAAKFIKLFLEKKYRIKEIVTEVIKDNPADLEKMMDYFKSYISNNENTLKTSEHSIIQLSAGTWQMTFALSFNIMIFPGVLYFIISRNEYNKSWAHQNKTFDVIIRKNQYEIISNMINNYEYSGTLTFFKETYFNSNKKVEDILILLIEKFNFNINDSSLKIARKYQKEDEFIFKEISGLYNNETKFICNEFYNQIGIYINSKNFSAGIALIFSLFDNLQQYLVEKKIGKKMFVKEGESIELKEFIEKNIELKKKFEAKNLSLAKPTGPALNKIISHFKDEDPTFKTYLDAFNKFNCFSDIRNKGPFAHGFKGLSEKGISENYLGGIDSLLNDLKNVLSDLNLLEPDYSYDKYNQVLIKELLKGIEP